MSVLVNIRQLSHPLGSRWPRESRLPGPNDPDEGAIRSGNAAGRGWQGRVAVRAAGLETELATGTRSERAVEAHPVEGHRLAAHRLGGVPEPGDRVAGR